MTLSRFIIALIILLLTIFIIVGNWSCVVISLRNRRIGIDRSPSMVPLVTIFFSMLAFPIYPYHSKNWIWQLPMIDLGNLQLLWLPFFLLNLKRGELSKSGKTKTPKDSLSNQK